MIVTRRRDGMAGGSDLTRLRDVLDFASAAPGDAVIASGGVGARLHCDLRDLALLTGTRSPGPLWAKRSMTA